MLLADNAWCSDVNVVMNCDKLSKLTTKYAAKSTALRDMADLFTSQIRAKKAPKRKTVRSTHASSAATSDACNACSAALLTQAHVFSAATRLDLKGADSSAQLCQHIAARPCHRVASCVPFNSTY